MLPHPGRGRLRKWERKQIDAWQALPTMRRTFVLGQDHPAVALSVLRGRVFFRP